MSGDTLDYDHHGQVRGHDSCVADDNRPQFDEAWQRRAFGLAVALSEFGHYEWGDFQQVLMDAIEAWQKSAETDQAGWRYYDHWVDALTKVVQDHGLLEPGYQGPRDDHDDEATP